MHNQRPLLAKQNINCLICTMTLAFLIHLTHLRHIIQHNQHRTSCRDLLCPVMEKQGTISLPRMQNVHTFYTENLKYRH